MSSSLKATNTDETRNVNETNTVPVAAATRTKVKFHVEKADESELLLSPASSIKAERGANMEAKVGQDGGTAATENLNQAGGGGGSSTVFHQQNDDVTIPLKQNANFELYDDNQQKPLSSFLSSILNFNSLIPAAKDPNDENNNNNNNNNKQKKPVKQTKLGTVLGVFLPCVQNIFGVILFIRASWIVGTAGAIQAALIIFMCCSCTFLTALSTSAIATNGIVPAGGPYFMISRSLGAEFGGAVGILFYLGNTVAASMYIVGAVEIFLKYICPQATLIGDIDVQSDAFHNFRIYGTILLIIIGLCVFVGIKFVSKLAPISLIAVLLSVACIYAGVIKSAFDPPDVQICVFNESRLIRYEAYMINGQNFCTNKRDCVDATNNKTFECPLWTAYCGPLYGSTGAKRSANGSIIPSTAATPVTTANINELKQSDLEKLDDPVKQAHIHLCHYFQYEDSIQQRMGIPGVSSIRPISENYASNYRDEGEIYAGEQGLPHIEVLGKEITSFLILVGIYFPSVTGIMAGSNRSGDLKDPSQSIPKGTITAILCTSFVYLSSAFLFGSTVDGLLLRDKFGESVDKKLVVSLLAWPSKWIVMVGAFLSTFGAGLQSLTSAPRLLQAVSRDDLIPFLRPLTVSYRGEPFRALLVTVFLCWCGILLGNVDYLTPLIAMFFLMCYGFVNLACALQTLLKAPSWRPRYKYYHWSLSLAGLFLCLFIMFIIRWYYAIVAIILALIIYKYIEYKGAEKEWGDGLRGLSMSAARYALLKLEQAPPHVKNWRPQILIFVKCNNKEGAGEKKVGGGGSESSQLEKLKKQQSTVVNTNSDEMNDDNNESEFAGFNIEIEHPNVFAFASQLKSGKGLIVASNVIGGNFIENARLAKACKYTIGKTMESFRSKGFCDTLVCENIEQGLCNLIQTEGMGGLRHNTIVLNWPNKWNRDYFSKSNASEEDDNSLSLSSFVQTLRYISADDSAIIITKGIDSWPVNSKTDVQSGTIDLWWIIHDGGLLLLIVFLLKKHKIWQKCKIRLFTVAKENEHSVQIKNDLVQYMYYLRIDAEVDVIEMNDSEISAYTYQKTLKLHEREKLMREMRIKERQAENEPQIVIERARRSSVLKQLADTSTTNMHDQSTASLTVPGATTKAGDEIEMNTISNEYTFSAARDPRRPSIFQTDTIRKMHSAVELNKKIVEKSRDASLVLLNIPTPPVRPSGDYNYMAYINAATEGLNRVLLVRGSGREVITIFS